MVDVRMPNLGEGVTEGTIVRWLKAEGDAVGEGEILAEIMTDKVNVEFESPAAGIVRKLHFPEEAVVKVGTIIALVEPTANSGILCPPQSPRENAIDNAPG